MIRIKVQQLILIGSIVMNGSCAKPLDRGVQSSNSEVVVGLLFVADGCKVYRFLDGGYYHYFVNCDQLSHTTISTRTNGKVKISETIQTVGDSK